MTRGLRLGSAAVEPLPEDGWDPAGDAPELLRRIGAWPRLRSETRRDRVVLRSRLDGRTAAVLDTAAGVLTVAVAPERAAALLARHPELRAGAGGVRLDVRARRDHRLAEQLLHELLDEQVFGPQRLAASS